MISPSKSSLLEGVFLLALSPNRVGGSDAGPCAQHTNVPLLALCCSRCKSRVTRFRVRLQAAPSHSCPQWVSNRRKDFLHKLSTKQVRESAAIFVGDVNAQALARTRMAKSVLDAGWNAYRTMLSYKCDDAGVWFPFL